ncbi:hypothetical protein JOD52_000712 [Brachybacterium muris]|nr:hypothetical protein [Brachybacterium muris]
MSRRGILGGATALAVAALTGCSVLRKDRAELITDAVLDVDGVTGADLTTGTSSSFSKFVAGTVDCEAESSAAGLAVYDEAMREAVTLLHGLDESNTVIGGITGRMPDGTEFTPLELDPAFPTDDHRLDYVVAASLYPRYGLA